MEQGNRTVGRKQFFFKKRTKKLLSLVQEGLRAHILHRDQLAGVDWSDVSTGASIGPVLDFMEPLRLSARALARDLAMPPNLIIGIVNGQRAITARTAILLSTRFATRAEFWMNLQTAHELERARAEMGRAA